MFALFSWRWEFHSSFRSTNPYLFSSWKNLMVDGNYIRKQGYSTSWQNNWCQHLSKLAVNHSESVRIGNPACKLPRTYFSTYQQIHLEWKNTKNCTMIQTSFWRISYISSYVYQNKAFEKRRYWRFSWANLKKEIYHEY